MCYQQLSALGYKTHHIVALDAPAYLNLTQDATNYRVLAAEEFAFNPGSTKSSGIQGKKGFNKIMGFRQKFMKDLVFQGYNVIASDTDSIWLQKFCKMINFKKIQALKCSNFKNFLLCYVDIASEFSSIEKADVYHAKADNGWPRAVESKFGFTVCGCFLGYRSTDNTKDLQTD